MTEIMAMCTFCVNKSFLITAYFIWEAFETIMYQFLLSTSHIKILT